MNNSLRKIYGVAIAAVFVLGSTASWAGPVIINNPSFEVDIQACDGCFTNGLISGWSLNQNQGVVGTWNPSHSQTGCGLPDPFLDIPDGVQVGYSNGGEISQQTGATITAGHRYTLKVWVGGRCNIGNEPYAILLAGTTQVGASTGTQTSPSGNWIEVTVTYDSPADDPNAGQPLTVVLENKGGPQLNWDNVRLDDSIVSVNVDIDIKPGSDPNSINLCSNGAVPVAILGSATLNVSDINTENLRFSEAAVKVVGKKDPSQLCSVEDINGDFNYDLVCHYVTTDIAGIDGESTTATVNGELFDGTPIEGTDSVNIVKDTCN